MLAIHNRLDDPRVFFTDRVSPAAIEMARRYANRGAIVYFEPSGIGDEKLFRRMLEVSVCERNRETREQGGVETPLCPRLKKYKGKKF